MASGSLRIEEFTYLIGGHFQIKKLKGQLEERQKNSKLDNLHPGNDVLENGTDMHVMDLQSKCPCLCRSKPLTCPVFIILGLEEKNHHGKECLTLPWAPQKPLSSAQHCRGVSVRGQNEDGQVGRARVSLSEPKD